MDITVKQFNEHWEYYFKLKEVHTQDSIVNGKSCRVFHLCEYCDNIQKYIRVIQSNSVFICWGINEVPLTDDECILDESKIIDPAIHPRILVVETGIDPLYYQANGTEQIGLACLDIIKNRLEWYVNQDEAKKILDTVDYRAAWSFLLTRIGYEDERIELTKLEVL